MKRFFVLPVFTAMVISSCHYINRDRYNGSGKVIAQNRSFSGFTDVDVSNSIVLYVRQDSVFSVRVETDDNLHGISLPGRMETHCILSRRIIPILMRLGK